MEKDLRMISSRGECQPNTATTVHLSWGNCPTATERIQHQEKFRFFFKNIHMKQYESMDFFPIS